MARVAYDDVGSVFAASGCLILHRIPANTQDIEPSPILTGACLMPNGHVSLQQRKIRDRGWIEEA